MPLTVKQIFIIQLVSPKKFIQDAPFLKALSQGDVEKLLVTGSASPDVGVRMNIVNIAGNIGLLHVARIVAKETAESDKNPSLSAIVNFLVEAATRDVDLRVVAEALDKIIDIFTEDETDSFCVEVKTRALYALLKYLRSQSNF